MLRLLAILLTLFLSGCNLFDSEKVSSEKIYEEEVQTIDWTEVDSYPLFNGCNEEMKKNDQRNCFIKTINEILFKDLHHRKFIVSEEISDTVRVILEVNEKGKIQIIEMKTDSLLTKEFPEFENLIHQKLDSFPFARPALKRGIPVKTQFTLPVIIQTQ